MADDKDLHIHHKKIKIKIKIKMKKSAMNTINAVNDECYMEILCRKQLREMQSPRWRLELFKSFSLIIWRIKFTNTSETFLSFKVPAHFWWMSDCFGKKRGKTHAKSRHWLCFDWLRHDTRFFFLISQSTWHLLQLANQVQRGPALSFARAEITERSIKHIFRLSLMSVLTG